MKIVFFALALALPFAALVSPAPAQTWQPSAGHTQIPLWPGHLRENTKGEFDLNPLVPVTSSTPPTFLVQAEDDNVDGVKQSLVYYIALMKAKVPVEMHLYAQGGHAFGLRHTKLPISDWPKLVETWLHTLGMTQ